MSDQSLRVTYGPSVDAAYIYLTDIPPGGVHRTYPLDPAELGAMVNVDLDADGRLVGIEVIDARHHLPESLLRSATLL